MSGLRVRKKLLMRQQLSDAAARLFLERGFDFRVAEVAAACGVSEKTVFNYFPTKEALLLDQLETTMAALRTGLGDRDVEPLAAARQILAAELDATLAAFDAHPDPSAAVAAYRRFGDLLRGAPSLRAYQSDLMDRFVGVAAVALAERMSADADDPEPQIAAAALLGLWRVQFHSLRRHLDGVGGTAALRRSVTTDVERAARLLDDGFGALAVPARRPAPAR